MNISGKMTFWDLLSECKIHIPQIQRDYAQGRLQEDVTDIREDFVNAIQTTLADEPQNSPVLELDFVYGSTIEGEHPQMQPLDGQQRLTTLFLLHWYAYITEFPEEIPEIRDKLAKFTYASRRWTEKFCQDLVKHIKPQTPWESRDIKSFIKDQSWYQFIYDYDPSIMSMLEMLGTIQQKFATNTNIWKKLTEEKRIVFYFQPLTKFGLSDDLYIKMNARGKSLTEFEIFKSEFLGYIKKHHADKKRDIAKAIDGPWTDFFWNEFNASGTHDNTDSEMLRFITFYSSILFFGSQEALKRMNVSDLPDDFRLPKRNKDLIARVFETRDNLDSLEKCFNALVNLKKTDAFFDGIFTNELQPAAAPQKIRLFSADPQCNLFRKCCFAYDPHPRVNPFPISEQLLLYACLLHLINNSEDFPARLRILRNLLANSEDTLRENYLPQLIRDTENLVLHGNYDRENTKFRTSQCEDEERKMASPSADSQLRFFTENNQYLRGACHLFSGSEQKIATEKLMAGFNCLFRENTNEGEMLSHELRRQLLLCFGDYSQYLRKDPRYRIFAHKAGVWRNLLTPSGERSDFNKIKDILCAICLQMPDLSGPIVNVVQDYIASYLEKCPKDWRYYMVKYDRVAYRMDSNYGCFYWEDREKQPYQFFLLKSSYYGDSYIRWNFFHNCLNSLMEEKKVGSASLDKWGSPLNIMLGDSQIQIENQNNGFQFETINPEGSTAARIIAELKRQGALNDAGFLAIPQDDDGIDQEDRVEKFLALMNQSTPSI